MLWVAVHFPLTVKIPERTRRAGSEGNPASTRWRTGFDRGFDSGCQTKENNHASSDESQRCLLDTGLHFGPRPAPACRGSVGQVVGRDTRALRWRYLVGDNRAL